MPDHDLTERIERSAAGDLSAFEGLVERFQDMAVGYAYSILGDFQLAEDTAQEAFVDAHRNIGQLREPRAFSSWLRRIVFKHCDRVTRAMKSILVPLDVAPDPVSRTPDPFEVTAMGELNDAVHRGLAELPGDTREVVTLYYISEYTQAEIATYLNVSVDTIKRRLREGRTLLKEGFLATVEGQLREHRPSRDDHLKEQIMKVIAGDKERHSEQTYQLIEQGPRPGRNEWREGRVEHSHTDWNVTRVGVVDGKVIAAFGVFDIAMRIGSATLRVGGSNWGACHPDYEDREDEITQRLAAESFEAMRASGYDMAANFEREDFAGQDHIFGWREFVWSIPTDALPSAPLEFELTETSSNYREDLGDLYNRHVEGLTGTAVRPTFLRNKHPDHFTTWYWTDGDGERIGYVSGGDGAWLTLDAALADDLDRLALSPRLKKALEENRFGPVSDKTLCIPAEDNRWWIIDPVGVEEWMAGGGSKIRMVAWKSESGLHLRPGLNPQFRVDEAAGDPDHVLTVIGKLARESGHRNVVFDRLHYRSPIARRLRQMPESHLSVQSPIYYLRILNLASVFEKLAPELSRRLAASLLEEWQGDLIIANGEEEVMLAIDRSDVQVVPVSRSEHSLRGGGEILQLIVGSDTPDEVVDTNGIEITGNARHLVRVLFPVQYPQMENQAM